jgi:hypothetical protein
VNTVSPDSNHVEILCGGSDAWNAWREKNPSTIPDLTGIGLPLRESQMGSLVDLQSALLQEAILRFANLSTVNLEAVDMSGADLTHARLLQANLNAAKLTDARSDYVDFSGASLTKANLCGASLRFATLSKADLEAADLSGADLRHARLDQANLSAANLTNACLDYADFTGVNLTKANCGATCIMSRIFRPDKLKTACIARQRSCLRTFRGRYRGQRRKVKPRTKVVTLDREPEILTTSTFPVSVPLN